MKRPNFIGKVKFYIFDQKERILGVGIGRFLYLCINLSLYSYQLLLVKNYYTALASLLRYERDVSCLAGEKFVSQFYKDILRKFIGQYVVGSDGNLSLKSFIQSPEAAAIRDLFSSFGVQHAVRMKYPKNDDDPDRQGDLIVLKPYISPKEKGVLFIQYDEGVKRFAALFDIVQLAKYYRFIIEPSTCGYQNPMFYLCMGLDTDVILEAQYEQDFNYIGKVGQNFFPIRLGAGDWANPALFEDSKDREKRYDIVMIANWLKWKRHELLFSALAELKHKVSKVAIIGYSIDGRTLEDVRRECRKHGVDEYIDFYERIPHKEVANIICDSKFGILLSKEEGANRGIYECFFSNVPVILSKINRGVNRDHVNEFTGKLAADNQLPEIIEYMLQKYTTFQPRTWALSNTGYTHSTVKLNEMVETISTTASEEWTKDIFYKHNSPHARFVKVEEREEADQAVDHLVHFLRVS